MWRGREIRRGKPQEIYRKKKCHLFLGKFGWNRRSHPKPFTFPLYPVLPLDIRFITGCIANFVEDTALTSSHHRDIKQVRLRLPWIWHLQYECHTLQAPSPLASQLYCHCVHFEPSLMCTLCPLAGTCSACYISVQCLGQCGFGFPTEEQCQ